VYAEDIKPEYLRDLAERVREEGLRNVTLVLGDPHDPRLPARSVDVALLVHMYHEVEQPYALLHNLRPALAPGARVAVLDLDRATNKHGTPRGQLRCEVTAAGYRQTGMFPVPSGGYLAVFEPGEAPAFAAVRVAAAACGAGAAPEGGG
jgi:SAM-dependent methyltransferase